MIRSHWGAYQVRTSSQGHALDPVNAATNDGFLRDEGAVLAMFVLSDEVDQSQKGGDVPRHNPRELQVLILLFYLLGAALNAGDRAVARTKKCAEYLAYPWI